MAFQKGHKGFNKKDDEAKAPEPVVTAPEEPEVKVEEAVRAIKDFVDDAKAMELEKKLAEAQAKIAELEAQAKSAKLIDEPDPDFHIIMQTKFRGDHVKLVNGKTVEFKNSYARIPRSDTTSYELLKKNKLWGSEYIEVNKMAVVMSGPGVQTGPLTTLRGKPQGGNP